MKIVKRAIMLILMAFVWTSIFINVFFTGNFKNTGIKALSPTMLPTLVYKDVNGTEQQFDASKNPLTIIHFWAIWCPPCVAELPKLDEAQKKYADNGLKVIALSLDGKDYDKVKEFFISHKITNLTPYFDEQQFAYRNLRIKGLPSSFFINSKGEIIGRADGAIDWQSEQTAKFIDSYVVK